MVDKSIDFLERIGELVTVASAEGVPEPRECVVFGWIGGPDLAERRSAENWGKLGELMGTMHAFAEHWTPSPEFHVTDYDSCIPYGEPLVVFEPGRTELHGLESVLREATAATNERIEALAREVPPIVLHGDMHQWNVKIKHGVLSPFDFEDLLTDDIDFVVNAAAGLFILPFFLFSALFGQFADKYEKSMLMRRIKLLDFGIVKEVRLGPGMAALTESGTAIGTPTYMSPEQTRGERVDARSDLYSVGLLLYELLALLPFFFLTQMDLA